MSPSKRKRFCFLANNLVKKMTKYIVHTYKVVVINFVNVQLVNSLFYELVMEYR